MAPSSRLPRFFSFVAGFLFLTLSHSASGQESADKANAQPQAAASVVPAKAIAKDKATAAAAKAKIEQQKAVGLSLLVSLANDARNFSDQKLRARTLSRIADALWDADPEQGRALFRKAWDSAESADQETARRLEEDRQRERSDGRGLAVAGQPDLRAEVLRLAAKRDRALGEELLDKLKDAKKQEATDATSASRADSSKRQQRSNNACGWRTNYSRQDVERALQFADPALSAVTMEGISFLSFLRDKNPGGADQRYARLLAITDADVKSDANTVSLLSSYLFTPHLYVTFEREGQSSSQTSRRTPPPEVSSELRAAFFRTAAGVLLRPSPSREQDRSSSGMQGKYSVIRRLMPLFEQYAAKEITDQLRNEMAVLAQGTNRDADPNDENPIQRGITPDRKPEEVEKAILDRIDRAKTSEERDALYLQLATRTAQRGDLRARDFADKVEDSELRKQVRPYVDMVLALAAVEKKDSETAMMLSSKGDLTHVQKVWLMTQTAKALPPTDREKALQIIAEAAAEARRIDVSDPDRPRALIAVANALVPLDRTRAWETMLEVAKASNSVAAFNGEDGRLFIKLQSKNMTSVQTSTVDDFNLPGIFRALSQENSTQAIELARSFEGEAPRSTALIAVGRSLLSDKK